MVLALVGEGIFRDVEAVLSLTRECVCAFSTGERFFGESAQAQVGNETCVFNRGVVLFDAKRWRELHLTRTIEDLLGYYVKSGARLWRGGDIFYAVLVLCRTRFLDPSWSFLKSLSLSLSLSLSRSASSPQIPARPSSRQDIRARQ